MNLYKQVSQSALCRAVQDGFLLSDLPDLWLLLLVKLIAQTQANTCLSCPISCSTTPGVTRTSSACCLCMSSVHHPRIVRASSTHRLHIVHVSSVHAHMLSAPGHIICTLSAGHLHHSSWSLWA